jgi:hypothetical protein
MVFWSKVGSVSQSLEGYDGLVLSIGVGEWPLIQQATISIWKTQKKCLIMPIKIKTSRSCYAY